MEAYSNNTDGEKSGTDLKYAWVFGSILTVGLPLNVVALWILLRHHSLRSPNVVFMVNLAISDLLLVISLPLRVYSYATGIWPLGKVACTLTSMLFLSNIRSSSIFITFISVDRLLAVVFPLRSRRLRTSSNAWKAAVLIWLFVIAINIPESISFLENLRNNNSTACFSEGLYSGFKRPTLIYYQPLMVFILLAVNIVCTALVFRTLHKHLHDSAKVNNRVNVMLLYVMNLFMFTICFFPLSVAMFSINGTNAIRPLICLATLNCCLDPLLYYFSMDAFWKKKGEADTERQQ